MVVRDHDFCSIEVGQHVTRDDFSRLVVAVWVVGEQDAKSITNRDAWRDQEKATRELLAVGPSDRIDRLPSDQHRHDRCFARTSSEFERQSHKFGISGLVGISEVVEEELTFFANLGCYFRQPDRGFRSFDLAEERA